MCDADSRVPQDIHDFGRTKILHHLALVRLDATSLELPFQDATEATEKRRIYAKIKRLRYYENTF